MLHPLSIPLAYCRPIMYYYPGCSSTYYTTPAPNFATYIAYAPIPSPIPSPPPYTVGFSAEMSSDSGGGGSGETPHQPPEISKAMLSPPVEEHLPLPPPLRFVPLRGGKNKGWVWLPRRSNDIRGNVVRKPTAPSHPTAPSPSLEFDDSHRQTEQRTTVMIRNIPNKLSRDMLMQLLDEHCSKDNGREEQPEGSLLSEYDFVYLPMDFRNKCNLGYAFVNFTTAVAAWRAYESLHRCKWDVFASGKITHVCYARIQGKSALVEHFRRSWFQCDSDDYLPAVLSPPRDGSTSLPAPSVIGRRAKLIRPRW